MTELSQELQTTAVTTAANDDVNTINATKNQGDHPEEFIDFSKNYTTSTYYHTSCTACGCCGSPSLMISGAATTPNDDSHHNNFNVVSSCNENKRRYDDPVARYLDSEPVEDHQILKKPKKLFLDDQTQEETIVPNSLHDFSKIRLPSLVSTDRPPNNTGRLQRSHSDPQTTNYFESLSWSGPNQSPALSPESVKIAPEATARTPPSKTRTVASLPPLPPSLKRTVSDTSPNSKPSSSSDCVADHNPNYQVLKRMRDCFKEMNQWWDEFLPEKLTGVELEERKGTEDSNPKRDETVADVEEAVQVERIGDCLAINFKCPCNKGYKILLSGKNCYYKLM